MAKYALTLKPLGKEAELRQEFPPDANFYTYENPYTHEENLYVEISVTITGMNVFDSVGEWFSNLADVVNDPEYFVSLEAPQSTQMNPHEYKFR